MQRPGGTEETALGSTRKAWGLYNDTVWWLQEGDYGSYGLNIWFNNPYAATSGITYGRNIKWFWRRNPSSPYRIPMFVDCAGMNVGPRSEDTPPSTPDVFINYVNMEASCMDRHRGAVGVGYADGSIKKTGLKELWTLKWHQEFNTAGPWTSAGGRASGDWPAWMQGFKDY